VGGTLGPLATLILQVLTGAVVYIVAMAYVDRPALVDVRTFVTRGRAAAA
jgi:hypothetical protein